ncbi:hypothetical protein ACTXLB_16410 [Brachybacterium tyrofermentans]|uniref:hypothetical protein n=1 Tax=Brachybacterium tyrofermentans TaxID=47848 RepID=UPI003FD3CFD6
MTTVGWLVAAGVAASALAVCIWTSLRARCERRRLTQTIQHLTGQIELQRDSLEALVEARDAVTDALGTMMMLANSYSATITSYTERREALILIARTCREAEESQRQCRLNPHDRR